MQLKTIFNRVTNFKPFVVERVELTENGTPTIEITMRPRENGLPTCSGCGQRCSGYDMQPTPRRFDFVPLWMIPVVLVYTMRRAKDKMIESSVAAACSSKLNFRQKRLRKDNPQARFSRLPKGE